MWRKIAILVLILHSSAFAQNVDEGRFEMSEIGQPYWLPNEIAYGTYEDFKNELANLTPQPMDQVEEEQCRSSYQKLYSKPVINWSIYFGYGDGASEKYTTDAAERDLFEKEIKGYCPQFRPDIQLCEFKADPLISGQYTKQIRLKNGQSVIIRLKLFNASLTSEIAVNKERKADQKKKSKALERSYIHAFQVDDIVFYSGHARHGTGPGFRPLSTNGVSRFFTGLFRPMANKMYNAIGEDDRNQQNEEEWPPRNPPEKSNTAIMGFFACEAEAHYGVNLAHRTDAGLIMTRQSIATDDNMRLLYAATNNILNESCEKDFSQSMNKAIKTIFYNKKKAPPVSYQDKMPKFFNFFHKDKVKYRNDILLYFHNKGELSMDISDKNQPTN